MEFLRLYINLFIVLLYGLFVGSFLNVLIDRLPSGESVLWGRSRCDYCKKSLRWWELIPLVSFFLQRGRCRRCSKFLSLQYPLVEFATGTLAVTLFVIFRANMIVFTGYVFVASSFLVIFFSDIKYHIIPDSMIVFAGIGGVILLSQTDRLNDIVIAFYSAFGSALIFFVIWLATRGKGMGFGDVKLAFVLGLILGFPKVAIALYLAFLTGAVAGVILIVLKRKSLKTEIAFGPFLIIGTAASFIWGQQLFKWWQGYIH